MVSFGYALSSEEHGPNDLVRQAVLAEESGFECLSISDHYHPWVPAQGHSPFVWAVLGGIANATSRIPITTGVTCPTMRIHPAIIAQAAATTAAMFNGRFSLGLGSGEALNEQILGDPWPSTGTRQDMLREAIEVIRKLWTGEETDFYGEFYTVRSARLFTLPDSPIPIIVGASGPDAAEIAGEQDGLMATKPDPELVQTFRAAGGGDNPRYAQLTLSWAPTPEGARRLAVENWPISALSGRMHSDIPTPALFEQALSLAQEDKLAEAIPTGSKAEDFVPAIETYIKAGYSHILLHPVGPDQAPFFQFWERELRPAVAGVAA